MLVKGANVRESLRVNRERRSEKESSALICTKNDQNCMRD